MNSLNKSGHKQEVSNFPKHRDNTYPLATARLHPVVIIPNLKERDTNDRRELSEPNAVSSQPEGVT